MGEWAKASAPLQKATVLSPQHARAYSALGKAQVKLRQFAEAAETLTKALELNPASPITYHELGTAYLNQKKYEEAIVYFKKANQLAPSYPQPYHGLATAYMRKGEREKGRAGMLRFQQLQKEVAEHERLSRLTQAEPDTIEAWTGLGKLLLQRKNYAAAVPAFQKCIELDAQNGSCYHGLSQALIRLGYPVPAREAVQNAIKIHPHESILYNTLGSTYAMQGKTPNAIKAFLKAAELDPKVPYYHLNLAKLYEQIGRPKLAKEHYEQYEHFKGESPQ